jgi:pyruvate/2-oxoglutarate dehydrogenase complex dihydrolipoamide dehydrogenase (E3) component
VAIAERELIGGECSHWACIPSKTLLRPGEALAQAREAPGAAEVVGDSAVVAGAAFAWRDFQVNGYDDSSAEEWARGEGIDVLRGSARFTGPRTVAVGDREHTADHVVIATGSDPVIPPIDGLRELDGVWTNREATGLTAVPRRLLVLGGGPVGVEMAQAVRRMGAEVALVERGEHVLSREPRPLGEGLGEALEADGIELVLGRQTARARRDGGDYVLGLDDGSQLRGDRLLVATGRSPRTDGLDVEKAGIELGERGKVEVDARLSAGDGLWAIGDVTGVWPLTYVGKYQGRVVASNILGRPAEASYDAVPRVIFTDPQAAAVGEADGARTARVELSGVARTSTYTRAYDSWPGFLTLVSDGERLTGAYALGPEAGEWLGQATLAIRARVPLETMLDTIQPFPTFSEAYLDGVRDLLGR